MNVRLNIRRFDDPRCCSGYSYYTDTTRKYLNYNHALTEYKILDYKYVAVVMKKLFSPDSDECMVISSGVTREASNTKLHCLHRQ